VRHCRLVETVAHPTLGALRQVVTPVSAHGAAAPVTRRAPPGLGEHTVEALREAGFDDAAIDALLAANIVYQNQASPPPATEQCAEVAQ